MGSEMLAGVIILVVAFFCSKFSPASPVKQILLTSQVMAGIATLTAFIVSILVAAGIIFISVSAAALNNNISVKEIKNLADISINTVEAISIIITFILLGTGLTIFVEDPVVVAASASLVVSLAILAINIDVVAEKSIVPIAILTTIALVVNFLLLFKFSPLLIS